MVKIMMATCSSFDGKNEENDFISAAAGGESPGRTIPLSVTLSYLEIFSIVLRPSNLDSPYLRYRNLLLRVNQH